MFNWVLALRPGVSPDAPVLRIHPAGRSPDAPVLRIHPAGHSPDAEEEEDTAERVAICGQSICFPSHNLVNTHEKQDEDQEQHEYQLSTPSTDSSTNTNASSHLKNLLSRWSANLQSA
jgi:hypothetical protein